MKEANPTLYASHRGRIGTMDTMAPTPINALMCIHHDFEGKVKRIGMHYLLKLGCKEFICSNVAEVGLIVTQELGKLYEKIDKEED
jgi:hypothetical protein